MLQEVYQETAQGSDAAQDMAQSQVGASAEMGPWPAAKPTRADRADSLALFIKQETAKKKIRDAEREATYAKVDRQTDEVTTPLIVNDAKERIAHKEALAAQMDAILQGQNQNRQQQQGIMGQLGGMQSPELPRTKLGMEDIIAAGIASLVGGAQGFNQAVGGAYERQGQMDVQRFKEQSANQEMQREQLMLQLRQLGVDENTAQRMFEALQNRQWGIEDDQRNHEQAIELSDITTNRQLAVQEEMTKRAAMKDPAKVESYKALAKSPGGRAKLMELAGLDEDAKEAARQLTFEELLKESQIEENKAQTAGKVLDNEIKATWGNKKAEADYNLVIERIRKQGYDADQAKAELDNYPEEFRVRMANIRDQIAKRGRAYEGKPPKYYGEGFEKTFEQMQRIALQTIVRAKMPGSGITPQALAQAQKDYDAAHAEMQKITKAKQDYAKASVGMNGGGGNGPSPFAKAASEQEQQLKTEGFGRVERLGPGSVPNSPHPKGEGLDIRDSSSRSLDEAFARMKQTDFNKIIFRRRVYRRDKNGAWKDAGPYTGPHPHDDHVHGDYDGRAPYKAKTAAKGTKTVDGVTFKRG